jgi:hypothetical protein
MTSARIGHDLLGPELSSAIDSGDAAQVMRRRRCGAGDAAHDRSGIYVEMAEARLGKVDRP